MAFFCCPACGLPVHEVTLAGTMRRVRLDAQAAPDGEYVSVGPDACALATQIQKLPAGAQRWRDHAALCQKTREHLERARAVNKKKGRRG